MITIISSIDIKKFRRFLIKCEKSEQNHRRLCTLHVFSTSSSAEHGWTQLGCVRFAPNRPHMLRFQLALSDVTTSTLKPAFSSRIMHSVIRWLRLSDEAAPLLKNAAMFCTHDPRNGWNKKTKPWLPRAFFWASGVWSPRSVKPRNVNVLVSNETPSLISISSRTSTP